MKFSEEHYKYFEGTEFSTGYSLKLEDNLLKGRIETLLDIVRGKTVLHVGCCDHVPVIKEKIKAHTWLHGLLEQNCKKVVGIDIDKDAVDYVNENALSKQKVFCANITSGDFFDVVPREKYDYILLGEIVEHVDNPVDFLSKMHLITKDYVAPDGGYVITVPNCFCFLRSKSYRKGIEGINTDHRYWFSPFTIAKVLYRAGITPHELYFATYSGNGMNGANYFTNKFFNYLSRLTKKAFRYKSFRGDQIIIIGK